MKKNIKLIALDLDGTLLNSNKELTNVNFEALRKAHEAGIYIVPTTGRLASAMPAAVKELPFLQYVIACNGAQVTDITSGEVLDRKELTNAEALGIINVLKEYPGIYDSYINGQGFMNKEFLARAREFTMDENHYKLVYNNRTPVADLAEFITERDFSVQKVQIMFRTVEDQQRFMPEISSRLPHCLCTSSYPNNIEINCRTAHKGAGLEFLCGYLGIKIEQSMSFGDGSNDITMLSAAGTGVAMANAPDFVKEFADMIAPSCDENGVARVIEEFVL
ncbi:MAG: Cof-type HAD-IIB family hydrolase [Eubacteriales bacterium]|nr:Cof-type HAD-IIB family hydrolase [Eubacteriales bacterium]